MKNNLENAVSETIRFIIEGGSVSILKNVLKRDGFSERHIIKSGNRPILRKSWVECCAGLVLNSPAAFKKGIKVKWMFKQLFLNS